MTQPKLSKDIEVEVIFTFADSEESEEPKLFKDYRISFVFDSYPWQVELWLNKDQEIFPIGIPVKTFVEFHDPQSLSGKLMPDQKFNILASSGGLDNFKSQSIGDGRILKIIDFEKHAEENSENIVFRRLDETNQIIGFIENLCGKSIVHDEIFYKKLKKILDMENIQDYQWLWRDKPHCPHTTVNFESPKHIPQIVHLLPDKPIPIWFLVDISAYLSCWYVYNGTFAALENITKAYKFSQYYIIAKDFSWLLRKTNKEFIAIGEDVENKLKHFLSK